MEKSFIQNIKQKQFVAAGQQIHSALSRRVMETIAGRKVEIARSMGVPVQESVHHVFTLEHDPVKSQDGPKAHATFKSSVDAYKHFRKLKKERPNETHEIHSADGKVVARHGKPLDEDSAEDGAQGEGYNIHEEEDYKDIPE